MSAGVHRPIESAKKSKKPNFILSAPTSRHITMFVKYTGIHTLCFAAFSHLLHMPSHLGLATAESAGTAISGGFVAHHMGSFVA